MVQKLNILTIVLDGEPFIERFLPELEKLSIPWFWRIAEGTADNTHCTRWCSKQTPRFSRDGTSEFLTKISRHPNVRIYRRQLWDGKISMFNAMCADITEPSILLERDVDEIWTARQMEGVVKMFQDRPDAMRAFFWCRYFLGKNIVTTSTDGYGNKKQGEWLRAFRYSPNMEFSQHEAPILAGNKGLAITRDETRELGLVFDHAAWLLESQSMAKESYYQYKDAAAHWRRLQANTEWPIRELRSFLPWTGEGASADLFENVYPGQINPFSKL